MKKATMLKLLFFFVYVFSPLVFAQGNAHLLFHMGLGANGKFFVGGTIKNTGDGPVAKGYIIILPVEMNCKPMEFIMSEYQNLDPGKEIQFRIPIESTLYAYRIAGFKAFDDMGFELQSVDETKKIIEARHDKEVLTCKKSQNS